MTGKWMPWDNFSIYWLAWLALGFGIPEGWALFTGRPQDTLSYQVWHLGDVQRGAPWTFLHYLIFVLALWLVIHFAWAKLR
jgi:hypothetical protein